MKYKLSLVLFLILYNFIYAQKTDYTLLSIPESLKENANTVVINQQIDINILSQKSFTIKKNKVVCIFNENGLRNIDASEYYDASTKLKSIEAVVYNSSGKELKKIKRKDFKDKSVADGFSILTEGRIAFLDYTPTEYPFTIVYNSEIETSNTAFIPNWSPIDDTFESVLKSSITINYIDGLGFKFKEFNFENKNIIKEEAKNRLSYTVENLSFIKNEEYSPSFKNITPYVMFGLDKFNLEGVEGTATTWKEFGLWMYTNLLVGSDELSFETQEKIKSLVGNEMDPIKKARIVYQFVQDKTRYVSIQLGIGGWKPMLAKDVDRLGYGDCKALSNYTRALLKIVNVNSYYTIIYGGYDKTSMYQDFVSMQGNHVVLAIPVNEKLCFLECTSQTKPFGFEGDFTDDRFALLVKPDKGEIVKTNAFNGNANTQHTNGTYLIDENGNISGGIAIKSTGVQYEDSYNLEKNPLEKIDAFYKSHFSNINNLKIEKVTFNNNRETVEFTENLKLSAPAYGLTNAKSIVFAVNAFNHNQNIPQRYRTRNNPFEIKRGFFDQDEIEISLPVNYYIEVKPDDFEIKDKFGEYKIEISIVNPHKIIYKRTLLINKGLYEKTEYENYRKFKENIVKADNSKIIITKKPS